MIRILAVEDSPICQMGIKALLETIQCQYEIVADGETAVALASQYDLILMDIGLPGISGIEAARLIRKQGIATPIIALTAHGEDKRECLDAGMNGFIGKPLTLKSFEAIKIHSII